MVLRRSNRALAAIGLSALVLMSAGCVTESEAELIAKAKQASAANNESGAIVYLKSVIQDNQNSPEARFLLGSAFLKTGEIKNAIVELTKARDLRHPDNDVLPKLAAAMGAAGQYPQVIDSFATRELSAPAAGAELKSAVAAAYSALGQYAKGAAVVEEALKLDPRNHAARMLDIRFQVAKGSLDRASGLLDALIRDEPKAYDALQFKGDLLFRGKGDVAGAVAAYSAALAVNPSYVPAHSALTKIALDRKDIAGFRAQLAKMESVAPQAVETQFYKVYALLLDKEFKRARDVSQQLLRTVPGSPEVQYLAGVVEFKTGGIQAAEGYLSKASQMAPGAPHVRRLLAETFLRTGRAERAIAALQPLLGQPSTIAADWSLAAEAYLQLGDQGRADLYYRNALKVDPNDVVAGTGQALLEIRQGRFDVGVEHLSALASRSSETTPDYALVSLRLGRNDLDGALTAVDALLKKAPDQPTAHVLRGRILDKRKDIAGARESFRKALSLEPRHFTAVAGLAAIEQAQGAPDAALKLYEDLLAKDPQNAQALISLADLRQRAGASPDDVAQLLTSAVRASPSEAPFRILLIDHYLARRMVKEAVGAAEEASAAMPADIEVAKGQGRAYLVAGNVQQALAALRKVAIARPNDTNAHNLLAEAMIASSDYPSALVEVRRSLEIDPRDVAAHRTLARIGAASKRAEDALRVARDLAKRRPNEAGFHELVAELLAAQKDWDGAVGSFTAALKVDRTTPVAKRLHSILVLASRPAEADKFAASWTAERPKDADFLDYLGANAMAAGRYAVAEDYFQRVLVVQPQNAVALNNVAWLLAMQHKPGGIAMAQRANDALPGRAWIFDTLATTHAAEKKFDEAITWQRKAIALAPREHRYRFELAKLLISNGKPADAKTELQALSELGNAITWQKDVAALLKTL